MADTVTNLKVRFGADTKDFKKGISEGKSSLDGFLKSAQNSVMSFIGFAAISAALKSLVTGIINVRKEFEKYEAVLTNTLGSNKAARTEMSMLQQFAAQTPFALSELTGAFVKLTNYGLKPSQEEMRKYGDIAASVGKSFDQFAEAIADAVTGQFERLKEFGIKASKEGDKISFTFKGQTTVVENTAQSIKNYISSLGDMKGVAGSMAAIAGTLEGKISNMGDAWDGLMNTMGAGSSGIMVTVITWLTNLISMFDSAFKSIKQLKEAVRDKAITDGMNSAIVEIETMTKNLEKNGMTHNNAQKRAFELYRSSMDETVKNLKKTYEDSTGDQKNEIGKRLNLMIGEYNAVKEHYKAISELKSSTNKKDVSREIEGIKSLAELKELQAKNEKLSLLERQKLLLDSSELQKKALKLDFDSGKISYDKYLAELEKVNLLTGEKIEELRKKLNPKMDALSTIKFDFGADYKKVSTKGGKEGFALEKVELGSELETDKLEAKAAKIQSIYGNLKETTISVGEAISTAMNDMAVSFGENLGLMIAGADGAKSINEILGSVFGEMLINIGKAAIAAGTAFLAIGNMFKVGIASPGAAIAAIAAGIAMVAVGTAFKSAVASATSGGSTYSSASIGSSYGAGISSAGSSGNVRSAPQTIIVQGEFKLKNGDLVAAIDKNNQRRVIST